MIYHAISILNIIKPLLTSYSYSGVLIPVGCSAEYRRLVQSICSRVSSTPPLRKSQWCNGTAQCLDPWWKGQQFLWSQPCTYAQPCAVMQLTILGKSPNPLVNHRFRPCNGHFIGSQWPMVATTFRESWHQHPTKSTRSSVMITEGFSVRKHQARNHLYAATARVGEIWGSHVLLIYSSLLYILFSTLLYPSLLWSTTLLYSTRLYSTLLYSTLLFSTLPCNHW